MFLVMRECCTNIHLFLATRFAPSVALVHGDIPILLCYWEVDFQVLCITKSQLP